ncbi:PglZ domain-containing protein [uncultured Ilyobacter sp.]|uniref:PglZ domain-containing protein n=1 Tax=uncultured Ilyobacter sp. TaxID=544433 RepID=UPI0029F4BF69|nr:PglZ domain-containing protein [uncultured Ilyobacter sp.]
MIKIIKLVKSSERFYQAKDKYVEVYDLPSYLKGRSYYDTYKNSPDEFEIIVSEKSLFDFFLDVEEHPNVKVYEKIIDHDGHYLEEDIIRYSIFDNEKAEKIYDGNLSKEKNILKYHFEDRKNIFDLLEIFKRIRNKKSELDIIFGGEFLEWLPQGLRKKFYEKSESFRNVLLEGYIFSKYKRHNYNVLVSWKEVEGLYDFFKGNKVLEKQYIERENKFDLGDIEKSIGENYNKLGIYYEFDESRFIENISGELDFEKNFYLRNFLMSLDEKLQSTERKKSYIKFKEKFKLVETPVEELLELLEKIECISFGYTNINDWKKFFKNEYIYLKNDLSKDNILNLIKKCEKRYEVKLENIKRYTKDKWKDINKAFGNFFMENYNSLMSSEKRQGLDYRLEEIKKYVYRGDKILFIFIDCMRYDIWKRYENKFIEKQYYLQNEDLCLSFVPTVTEYCKKILFSGKKYNQIDVYNQTCFDNNFDGFTTKHIQNIEELEKDGNIFIYEITEIDKMFHDYSELDDEFLLGALDHKLSKILDYIENENMTVVIGTDHGSLHLFEEDLKSIDFREYLNEKNLTIDNHGRYMRISGEYFDEKLYNNLMEKFSKDGLYYLIDRENLKKYYLKETDGKREVYCYLIYKYGYYPYNTGEYNHGGVSLEEVMIPFAILARNKKEYIEVAIETIKNTVEEGKISDIKILLRNENFLKNVCVKLLYNSDEYKYESIEGNKEIDIPLNINGRTGEIADILSINFEFEGEVKEIKQTINIVVEENKKKKLNQKLKKSRSLL